MKICMFVKNSFEYDARVTKEAKTLTRAGHEVTIVALLAPRATPEFEITPYGATVVRVPRAEFGLGRITRRLSRTAERAVVRDAAERGVEVDEARLADARHMLPLSTATPGDSHSVTGSTEFPGWSRRGRLTRFRTRAMLAMVATARFALRALRFVLGWQGRAIKDRAIDRRMTKAGLSVAADVYHSHDLNTLRVGRRCAKSRGARLVYDSHELASERSRMGAWARWRARRVEGRLLSAADALIVSSPVWIEMIERMHGGLPPHSIFILNVPAHRDVVAVDVRPEVGLEPGVPLLLYQGSIQEHRGIEPAIEALSDLEDVALVVLGYGHFRPALERMVRSRGLGERVKFFGPVSNDRLLEYTASAQVGLCNIVPASLSYATSLPNKLFEYFMAGVPVIGSEAPEIARVVNETGAGLVVPATDSGAIAGAVKTILGDPTSYGTAAAAAAQRYRWEAEEGKLLDLYHDLAGGPS
jgi:glycosyltransferase involved in cell wall biosynthesis